MSGSSTDRPKTVRASGSQVVLWQPEIVLAPGAALASLEESRHVAGPRPAAEAMLSASGLVDPVRADLLRRAAAPAGVRPGAGLIPEGGWR
jgi:hypothetical protein